MKKYVYFIKKLPRTMKKNKNKNKTKNRLPELLQAFISQGREKLHARVFVSHG
jgi:hypothetical protein